MLGPRAVQRKTRLAEGRGRAGGGPPARGSEVDVWGGQAPGRAGPFCQAAPSHEPHALRHARPVPARAGRGSAEAAGAP